LFCLGSFLLILIGAGIYLIARKKKE